MYETVSGKFYVFLPPSKNIKSKEQSFLKCIPCYCTCLFGCDGYCWCSKCNRKIKSSISDLNLVQGMSMN